MMVQEWIIELDENDNEVSRQFIRVADLKTIIDEYEHTPQRYAVALASLEAGQDFLLWDDEGSFVCSDFVSLLKPLGGIGS
jgi:hypothetical protein